MLLTEACKPRTVGEAQKVAEAAAQAAAELKEAKPGVMHADMRTAAEPAQTKTIPVADAGKPEVKPDAAADAKAAEAKAAPRPRFIELPQIDKSKVEDPYAGAKPPEAKPDEKAATKPAAKPAEKPAEKTPVKAAEKTPVPVADRHERERQYATSGPRKTTRPARTRVVDEPAEPAMHGYAHWSYEGEGAPANWAKLRGDYATCSTGRRQSPIDIRDGIRVDLEPIAFDYKLSQFRIIDNGHTIQVNVGEGSTISVMGRTYRLIQFHFHKPGEERVNGRTYDMGIHFVHQDDEGKLAVVSVLLEKGAENPLIQTLWNNLPLEVDQDVAPKVAIDLKALLPDNRAYYTYMGSLTTPPCTEEVLWMVLKQSMSISPDQVAIFSRLYKSNARPVQPSNGRLVKESR
jgi:carbonic anhydrase